MTPADEEAAEVFLSGAMTYFYAVIFLAVITILVRLCMKVRKPSIEQIAILAGILPLVVAGAERR